MTTRRKDPADAGVYSAIRASIERCHAWLCANSVGLPAVVATAWNTAEQRELFVEQCRTIPYVMAKHGAPVDEEAGSPCALVRRLLLECEAASALDERPRRVALLRGRPEAAFVDDSPTREALALLERHGPRVRKAATLLLEEVKSREKAIGTLPMQILLGTFDERLREHARAALSALDALMQHARTVMEVDPPRTLKEFNRFRAEWSARLKDAGFNDDDIQHFLGYERSRDPTLAKDRIRKARKRRAKGR